MSIKTYTHRVYTLYTYVHKYMRMDIDSSAYRMKKKLIRVASSSKISMSLHHNFYQHHTITYIFILTRLLTEL